MCRQVMLVCVVILLGVCVASSWNSGVAAQEPGKKEDEPRRKAGFQKKDAPPKRSRPLPDEKKDDAPPPMIREALGRASRAQWEYLVQSNRELSSAGEGELQAALNKLGEDGWELVTVEVGGSAAGKTHSRYLFKRAKVSGVRAGGFSMGGLPQGFGGVVGGGGFGSVEPQPPVGEPKIIALKHANAPAIAQLLQQVFGQGRGGLRLACDERTNAIVAIGTEKQMSEIHTLIDRLEQLSREQAKKAK